MKPPPAPPAPDIAEELATAKRLFTAEHPRQLFQAPFTRLLMLMNAPNVDYKVQLGAAITLLPYFYQPPNGVSLPLGKLRTVEDIFKAQRNALKQMGNGSLTPAIGKQLVEALALAARTMEITELEAAVQAEEETAAAAVPTQHAQHQAPLVVIPGGEEDNTP
jgi:hypothetical protein